MTAVKDLAPLSLKNQELPSLGKEPTAACDVGIIGGGLAGLTLSILLAKKGWKVFLFEKNRYPFHKVCGEYISLESKPFLQRLGVDISASRYPHLRSLEVTAASGVKVRRPLDLGGFGVSRYCLDHQLAQIAAAHGVSIIHERVEDISFDGKRYLVKTNEKTYLSRACAGSFGKRSNLDVKWKRSFVQSKAKGLNNYLGIKYHIHCDHPKELIALHNFKDGYCGISAIEEDKYCLCYLTSASNLTQHGNDIKKMEEAVLYKNKQLKTIFTKATFLYDDPLVISQVSFANKEQSAAMVPLCGDAAGLITPLCGNGMSMAMKASSILAPLVDAQLQHKMSVEVLNAAYTNIWKNTFDDRLLLGRRVQSLFGNNILTTLFLQTCKVFPSIADRLIRNTHGEPF